MPERKAPVVPGGFSSAELADLDARLDQVMARAAAGPAEAFLT